MLGEYTCLDCGATFDEPKRWEERHGLDTPPYEQWSGCPFCGGAYAPTIICDSCGEPITGDYVRVEPSGEPFCDSCFMLKSFGDDS